MSRRDEIAEKYKAIREWRSLILGDRDNGVDGSSDALEDAITFWIDGADLAVQRVCSQSTELIEPPSFHAMTYLLASVCDLGPASIDPTPLTDAYGRIALLRARQSGKHTIRPASASAAEISDLMKSVSAVYPVLNRMRYAWVALKGRGREPDPDGPALGYKWRKDGEVIQETLPPRPWRLVNYLWSSPGKRASYEDLAPIVNDDHANSELDPSTCRSHRDKANDYFKRHDIPWRVTLRGGAPSMIIDGNDVPDDGTE